MKGLVNGEKLACNKYIIAATTVAFFLIMMMPNYSVLAYADKPSTDTMFFRVLKGDLNVCSPNYQYNITICQMVMKDEELSPNVGEITNSTHTNNVTNTTNSTDSSSYPPLSVNPEMVINEEQLQALLTNSSLNPQGAEGVRQNDTGSSLSNGTQGKGVGKIYVDEYPQYEPLVTEQPLEGEITIDNSLQRPWQSNQQPLFMNNQTISNGVHDIEEPVLPKDAIRQQDNHQDSVLTKEGSSLGDSIDNPKADTSNSYSSIPIGISLHLGN